MNDRWGEPGFSPSKWEFIDEKMRGGGWNDSCGNELELETSVWI